MSNLIIGVTGGIGSGKTTVTNYFLTKGIIVVDTDLAARVVVESSNQALIKISERYGKTILENDGSLHRRRLREIIFEDDNERIWLETLLHPLIRKQILLKLKQSVSLYTIIVSPLLIKTNKNMLMHRIMVIDTPKQIQLKRTMSRDGISEKQTQAIMAKQLTREQHLAKADDVVDNSGSLEHLYQQLEILHNNYLTLAKLKQTIR